MSVYLKPRRIACVTGIGYCDDDEARRPGTKAIMALGMWSGNVRLFIATACRKCSIVFDPAVKDPHV